MEDVDRGGGYQFRPGYPEIRLVTAGEVDQYTDSTSISVALEMVYASLVFKKRDSIFVADVLIDVQILNQDDPTDIIEVKSFPVTINETNRRIVTSQDEYLFEKKFMLDPGNYKINITVTDKNTNKQSVRSSTAYLPDPGDDVKHITNIQVLSKDQSFSNEFNPVTTYDISDKADTIRFVFQVTNNNAEEPLILDSQLIKFKSDTTIARPMSFPNYNSAHVAYRGIFYERYEVINSSRRIITQPGSVTIEFRFPGLGRGNYRFEVRGNEGEENELFKGRDFSVKSVNYPSLKTARELAAPLYYLMEMDEYEELMAIKDERELKKAIDRFWLSNIKNSRKAQDVISLYYQRVEEANKQFANYKEGWKTDMGMIYILFGPPWYTTQSFDQIMWSYSYNFNEFERNFVFRSPRVRTDNYPFDNYLLIRNQAYHQVEYRQRDMWLNGTIMRDNL